MENLQNCVSEDGENVITLPNPEFYKKYDELKNNGDKKEYIVVMDKLIKLRELKLKKEIERFKKLEIQSLSKEAENFENLLDDVKLTTRVYKDEEVAKHLFVKDPKTNEFGELFNSYQKKEEDLRKLDERIVKIYDNLIFVEKNDNPELIETFIDRIKYFENDRKNIVNEVFGRAFANNRLDVMEKLLSNEDLKNKIYINNNFDYCSILINNAIISNKIDMAKILIQNNFNNNFKRLNKNEEKIKLSMNEKSFIDFKKNLKNLANKQINDKKKLKKIVKNINDIKPIVKNNKKTKENSLEINKKKFESLKSVMKDLGLSVEEGLQL